LGERISGKVEEDDFEGEDVLLEGVEA